MTYCSTYIGDLDHPEFKWEGATGTEISLRD